MALTPIGISTQQRFAGQQPDPNTDTSRIVQNLPRARTAFVNKYNNPELTNNIPPEILQSLARFDAERVSRGQAPLSERQTANAVKVLVTGEASTQEREESNPFKQFIGGAAENIYGFATSIPRIPGALVDEVRALPTLPEELSQAFSESDNPLELISNVAQTPGIRFIPGAYVAENIQTPGELFKNPVFTALDVLPLASGAARGTRTFKTAQQLQKLDDPVKRIRPLPTVFKYRADDMGNLNPTRLGAALNSAQETLSATRAGQIAKAAFGTESKRMARMASEATERVKEKMRGLGLDDSDIDQFTNAVVEHSNKFDEAIPSERRVQLGEIATTDPAKIPDLPDVERAYLESYKYIQDELAAKVGIKSGELVEAVIDGSREIYDKPMGKRVVGAQQRLRDVETITEWREFASTATPEQLLDRLFRDRPTHKVDRRGKSIEGLHDRIMVEALGRQGYDVRYAREAARGNATLSPDDIIPRAQILTDDVIREIRAKARSDTSFAQLSRAITRGDWSEAVRKARLQGVREFFGDNADDFIDELVNHREAAKFDAKYGHYNPRAVETTRRRVDKIESRAVPARFQPLVTERVKQNLVDYTKTRYITDPNLPEYLKAARRLDIGALPWLSRPEFNKLTRDAALSWRQMRLELGENQPIFVHKVSPDKASKITYPQVVPNAPPITQTRARSFDATPYNRDLSVALNHQAVEWLQRRAADEFKETVSQTWGRTYRDISAEYREQAVINAQRRAAATGVTDVDSLVVAELNRLITKEYAPWRHEQRIPSTAADDALFIPKYLRDNIERMAPDKNRILSNVVDPAMGVFRTSVLALSPRWHVYNILGGSILLAAESGPRAFLHLGRAYRMVKSGEMIDPRTGIRVPPGATQGGMVSMPEDMVRWSKEASPAERAAAFWQFKGGQQARDWYNQARESRIAKAGKKITEKSYEFNGMMDDMYRTMAYLGGYDDAVRKGLTQEQAVRAGEGTARKILANWDEMTPLERSVMRYWFPFYGFNKFLLQYAAKYPVDHPFRASVMSAIARNEIEDHGTGLPMSFLNYFHMFPTDDEGNTKVFSTRGINPFSDVASWFSLAGFLTGGERDLTALTTNLNPALTLLLEQFGVDTFTASSQLFPDVKVDPETGRLVATSEAPSLPFAAAQSFIPQARVLTAIAGRSNQFKAMLQTNPDAAGRFLASSLGFPILARDINIPEEQVKAEMSRLEAQDRARAKALRDGNLGLLREYPSMREFADIVEKWQADEELSDEETATLERYNLTEEPAAYHPPAQTSTQNALQLLMSGLG